MSKYNVSDIRNIAFCGHGHSGKTSLADKLVNKTGAVTRPANVDEGTSICDFDPDEKQHKYTIETSLVHFDHGGKHFHVLDTPGYPDFIGQTVSALRAVDNAVIVINAHAGIEVNTRRTFQEAGKAGLGRFIVISKLDTENIDFAKLLENIQKTFGDHCIPFNVPLGLSHDFRGVASTLAPPADVQGAAADVSAIGETLLETIIEGDEEVMARYFEGTQPTPEEVTWLAIDAIAEGRLIPIVCVSTKLDIGLQELLDLLVRYGLPADRIARTAKAADGSQVTVAADPAGPLLAQVFKTRIDPFVQKLSYIRVFSGGFKKDEGVHVSGARKNIKLTQPLTMQGAESHPVDAACAGEIVALAKMDEMHTGCTLGDLVMPPIAFPTPMAGLAVTPHKHGDEAKLSNALHKLVEEEPTLKIELDSQTKEMVMTGMSELHLQILRERLKRRDKVEVDTKEPKIPYRETIQQPAEGSYRHKKQSGGRGQFGEVHIRMFPLPGGTNIEEYATKERFHSMRAHHYDPVNNFLWIDSIVGGTIPNNFLPAVEKGFKERMARGVIAGHQVQNVCVEVHFGKYHDVDSSEAAFKTAGAMAFRDVFLTAKPSLLEPHVILHVTIPSNKLGDITSDFSSRRGRVLGMDSAGGDMQTITAEVPLAEVTTYARSLSSMTGGQGSYTMEFSHYDLVPGNVQREIIEKSAMKEEEEE